MINNLDLWKTLLESSDLFSIAAGGCIVPFSYIHQLLTIVKHLIAGYSDDHTFTVLLFQVKDFRGDLSVW